MLKKPKLAKLRKKKSFRLCEISIMQNSDHYYQENKAGGKKPVIYP